MKKTLITLLALTTLLYSKMQVCVSIPPQAFFVQKVAGDLVDTHVLVKPGSNPSTYTPKPSQLELILKSSLYFTIGVAFEQNWRKRFISINKEMRLIDTTSKIQKISMQHNHDAHHHEGLDPHVWLDPMLVKLQIQTITDALVKEDPHNSKIYLQNAKSFMQELDNIDISIKKILGQSKQKEFIVFHPSFGYFAKAYGLKQIAIERDGKKPSLKYIKKVIDFATKRDIKTVFVAPQFSRKSAKQIAKHIGGKVVSIDPLSGIWDKNILEIAKSLESK